VAGYQCTQGTKVVLLQAAQSFTQSLEAQEDAIHTKAIARTAASQVLGGENKKAGPAATRAEDAEDDDDGPSYSGREAIRWPS
jgi:hypothetical protein